MKSFHQRQRDRDLDSGSDEPTSSASPTTIGGPSKPEKGDNDSWGDYDFEKEDQSAWRGDHISDDEADEDNQEDASDDEEEAMNDEEIGSSKKKNEDNSKYARQDEEAETPN